MRGRWLVVIFFITLVLCGIPILLVSLVLRATLAVAEIIPIGRPQSPAPPAPRQTIQAPKKPPQNLRDLAQKISDITGVEQGRHTPVELVQIGEDDYLVLISGTQLDKAGGNNLGAAIQEATKEPSAYQLQVHAIIEQYIPRGSTIHFAGHSLGGLIANNLAINQDFLEHYTVKTVTTFAAAANACENPDVAYRRYIVGGPEGDLVPLLHRQAILLRASAQVLELLGKCEEGDVQVDQTLIDHNPGPNGLEHPHSSYDQSRDLAREPLPFPMDRYESVGRFEADRFESLSSAVNEIELSVRKRNPYGIGHGIALAWTELRRMVPFASPSGD